jgi:5-(carboxyamino)imidazole ribonucleotide synthase
MLTQPVHRAPALAALARNRFLQKKFLEGCGMPTAPFRLARNHRELVVAHQALGFPGVLKLQFIEDDEPGPWIVRDFGDVPPVLRITAGRPLMWERAVAVDSAFCVVATRDAAGSTAIECALPEPVRNIATTIGERLGIVGLYAVAFFQNADGLLVDDITVPPEDSRC